MALAVSARLKQIARTQENLTKLVDELTSLGIESKGYAADLIDEEALKSAFASIKQEFGFIDIVEYPFSYPYENDIIVRFVALLIH